MPFYIDKSTALLMDTRYVPSPNCDARPENEAPSLIVLHGISLPAGEFGGPHIEQLFTNCLVISASPDFAELAELKVSSHLLIRRDGEVIQFVPFDRRAWHAGASQYQGRERCNDFSIGIELEGTDVIPYEVVQYERLAELIACLLRTYPSLQRQHITGHSDIAPDRKTDPGPAFEWAKLSNVLDGILG